MPRTSKQNKYIKQKGMAVLGVTMTLLAVITIITLFSARIIVTDNKIYSNQKNNIDAFNAAQAGIDYALGYLNVSYTTQNAVVTAPVASNGLGSCAVATSTTCLSSTNTLGTCSPAATSTLSGNGAAYTMQYSCIAAGNKTMLQISSVGKSADGSSTRTVQEMIMSYPLGTRLTFPVVSTGPVSLTGAAGNIINNNNGDAGASVSTTINSGSAITLTAAANQTQLNGALSSFGPVPPLALKSDAVQNIASLAPATMTDSLLQTTYLGASITSFKSIADIVLSPLANHTYTSANSSSGTNSWAGKIVYIDVGGTPNTATFQGSFFAGTAASPTLVIVNGNTLFQGGGTHATVNGAVYSTGQVQTKSQALITGFVFGTTVRLSAGSTTTTLIGGAVAGSGGFFMDTSSVNVRLDSVNALNSARYQNYGIVSGSWRDF